MTDPRLTLLFAGILGAVASAGLLLVSRSANTPSVAQWGRRLGVASGFALLVTLTADGFGPGLPLPSPFQGGNLLLWGGLATAAASAVLVALRLRFDRPHLDAPARILAGASALLLGAALVQLALAFLAGDLTLSYVLRHTRVDYPWYYRLTGLWASQEGTILLWAALMAGLLAFEVRRPVAPGAAPVRAWMHLTLAALVAAFAGLLIAHDTFAHATDLQRITRPDGQGLQEVLVTPFMIIHPPMQFVAYALAAMPAAAAFAGLMTGNRAWAGSALEWGRPAWLASTVGLGLGGLWAYYVLSFGGYWAWDPVETANLLPWLALTGLLHAVKHNERFGDFRVAAPALAILGLFLTVFATFATRSGLWVSVHAFTDPTNKFDPDAAQRLLSILAIHTPSRFFVGLLGVILFASAAAFHLQAAREAATPRRARTLEGYAVALLLLGAALAFAPGASLSILLEAGSRVAMGSAGVGLAALLAALIGGPLVLLYVFTESSASRKLDVDMRTLLAAAVLLFAISLAVTTLLDFQVINGMDRTVFDVRAPYVAIPLLLVMGVTFTFQRAGKTRALMAAGAALALGLLGAILYPERWVVAAAAPALAFALVGSVAKLAQVNLRRDAPASTRWGATLLLLASLLGLVMWSNPPSAIPIPGAPVHLAAWVGVVFFLVALVGLLASIAAYAGRARPLQLVGAACAALAVGYGAGALLALAALALLARAPPRAARSCDRPLMPALAPHLRQSGIYLLHVAVVVGLIGITASTYAASRGAFEVTPGGDPVALEGVTFVAGPVAESSARDRFVTPLSYGPTGTEERTELVFFWNAESLRGAHYDSELNVIRGFTEDAYLVPTGILIGERWVQGPHDTDFSGAPAFGPVTKVRFTATFLPLMTFVWAGLWLMGVGMILVLAGGLIPKGERAEAPVRRPQPDLQAMDRKLTPEPSAEA